MDKMTRNFFDDGQVILVGYSSQKNSFSHMVYNELVNAGVKVYPVNKNNATYDVEVFTSLEAMPVIPKTACVLTGIEGILPAIKELSEVGVKKILVQNKKAASEEVETYCQSNNMDLTVGCPMMAVGKGLHRFHGFLAGVK